MTDFVNIALVTDPNALLDGFIDAMNANLEANGFPGWAPSDGNLAVIAAGIISQWAANDANVATTMSAAAFRAYGTQLFSIPYVTGAYATVTTTWTFTSPAPTGGYSINAGTGVIVGGQAFYVQTSVQTATGDISASVVLVASDSGTAYNGLGGVDEQVDPVDQIDWVQEIITTGPSVGGVDQETDPDYQNRLASVLQLQAPRPITAADYAAMVLSLLAQEATGIAVGRATSIDGWYPAPRALSTGGAGSTVLTCTTVNGSPNVVVTTSETVLVAQIGATVTGTNVPAGTVVAPSPAPTLSSFSLAAASTGLPVNATGSGSVSLTVGGMSGYGPVNLTCTATLANGSPTGTLVTPPYTGAIPAPGATISGGGIPANTTILGSPSPTTTAFTMSANATSNETAETVKISEWTSVARCVTTFVTDTNGNALTPAQMDTLATWLSGFRELNFLVFVEAPSTTTIYVTAEIHCLPGYDTAAVVANVEAALGTYLSPATWGNPAGSTTGASAWLNYTQGYSTVRFNSIIGVIEGTPGVQYAVNGQVFLGTSASPGGTSDIALLGPAPLTYADTIIPTIVVTAV